MPRQVPIIIATVLGPVVIAVGILSTDFSDRSAKSADRKISQDKPPMAEASRVDRMTCFETGLIVRSFMSRFGRVIKPVDRGCKVKDNGDGNYEVESSFLVRNKQTVVHYTVLITRGVVLEEEDFLDGEWDKIKIHGVHDDFVPLSVSRPSKGTIYTCTEMQEQVALGIRPDKLFCYP